jgi:hypothetical protein
MDEENSLSIQQRAELLKRLGSAGPEQTPDAKEALRILNSLQKNQPQTTRDGRVGIKNPTTRIFAGLTPTAKGNEVMFSNLDTNMKRNPVPAKGVKLLGIRATINQLIDQIPTARNAPPGQSKTASMYSFSPIQDLDDVRKSFRRGTDVEGRANLNQRALAYKRFTKGAFQSFPDATGEQVGYGERIDQTTFQPRDAKRRFGKYVNFDPTDVVRQLGTAAGRRAVAKTVGGVDKRLAMAIDGALMLDDFAAYLTGKSVSDRLGEYFQSLPPIESAHDLMINR